MYVDFLMEVGNLVLRLDIGRGHAQLEKAWRLRWKPFFAAGVVERFEKDFYYAVRLELLSQQDGRFRNMEARMDALRESTRALEKVARA